MATLIQTQVTENRNKPRLWIEGARLAREGLEPGMALIMKEVSGRLLLSPAPEGAEGDNVVRISKRTRRGKVYPLLELRTPKLVELFGLAKRVVVKLVKGKLSISRHHQDEKIQSRNEEIIERLEAGQPLRVASLYHGGGVLDSAVHEGLDMSGVSNYCKLMSEIESAYAESSLTNNPHLFREDSIILNAPIEQLSFAATNIKTDILMGGVPCTGASNAGKAKNRIKFAEEHASAGAQFYAYLRMIELCNPAICLLENVTQYRNTPSYAIILSVLKTLGYTVQDRDLNGCEFGSLENRNRMVMVAVSDGLEGFDIEDIIPLMTKPETLAEVLEPDAVVEEYWQDYTYLREKEAKDKAAGKGFMRQLLDADATKVPTITRDYKKVRSTDPQLQHPTEPLLTRLFTALEHARIKGSPQRIIKDLSETIAHQILGQSVVYPAFLAVGAALGMWLRSLVDSPITPNPEEVTGIDHLAVPA